MKIEHITDREISWLSFDQRVLELAEDSTVPLLERLRFLAISSSNLDEFFMVRVATLMSKIEHDVTGANVAGYKPKELLSVINTRVNELVSRQSKVLHDEILPELKKHGIEFVKWEQLDETESTYVAKLFQDRIFPVLTPLAVDPTHPFPYISGLSLNLAVMVKNPATHEEFFARVKVPEILPRFIATAKFGSTRFLPLEDLIAIHLQELFPGMTIEDHYTFRVTRNQDIELDEDEAEDLLLSLEQELLRRRFGPPVRLEIEAGVDEARVSKLGSELGIGAEHHGRNHHCRAQNHDLEQHGQLATKYRDQGAAPDASNQHQHHLVGNRPKHRVVGREIPHRRNVQRCFQRIGRDKVVVLQKVTAQLRCKKDDGGEDHQETRHTQDVMHGVIRVERNAVQGAALRVFVLFNLNAIGVVGAHLVQSDDVCRDQSEQHQRHGNDVEAEEAVQSGVTHHVVATDQQSQIGANHRHRRKQVNDHLGAPVRHLTPRQQVTHEGFGHQAQEDGTTKKPHQFAGFAVRAVNKSTEHVEINHHKKC